MNDLIQRVIVLQLTWFQMHNTTALFINGMDLVRERNVVRGCMDVLEPTLDMFQLRPRFVVRPRTVKPAQSGRVHQPAKETQDIYVVQLGPGWEKAVPMGFVRDIW